MGILGAIKALLSLAGALASWAKQRGLIRAGEKAALAEQMTDLVKAMGVARDVEESLAVMSDSNVDERLLDDWCRPDG